MKRMISISEKDIELVEQLNKGIEVNELPNKKEVVFSYINKNELVEALQEAVTNEELNFESHTLNYLTLYYYLDETYSEDNNAAVTLESEWVFPSTINTEEALAEYIIENGLPSESYVSDVYCNKYGDMYFWNDEADWNKNRVVATIELSPDVRPIQSIEAENIGAKTINAENISSDNIGSNSQYIKNGFVSTMYVANLRVKSGVTSPSIGESTDAKRFKYAYLKDLDVKCGVGDSVRFQNLPTSDPHIVGNLWNDNGTLKISLG